MIDDGSLGAGPLLADTSAWQRAGHRSVADLWIEALTDERVITTPPIIIELLYSRRDIDGFDETENDLAQLRSIPLTQSVARTAIGAMKELAAVQPGYHRVPLADLLVAAAAQEAGAAVLHYDHHYDRLAQVLHFESRWIAPAGSLDPP